MDSCKTRHLRIALQSSKVLKVLKIRSRLFESISYLAAPSYRCRWQINALRVVPIASSIGSILIPLPSALVVIDG
jgi:hypothetical protein